VRAGEGGRERGEERGREGELTSGLDDRQQPLTGIPPRARGDGREVEEREREVAAWEKKMRERGAHMGGRAPGVGPGQVGLGSGPDREPTPRTNL
jgi:hypothetical protein